MDNDEETRVVAIYRGRDASNLVLLGADCDPRLAQVVEIWMEANTLLAALRRQRPPPNSVHMRAVKARRVRLSRAVSLRDGSARSEDRTA